MNLLLDTHAFLWWCDDDLRLDAAVRASISDAESVFVSVASAWEAAIKISSGKLKLTKGFGEGIAASGFQPLPITFAHVERVATLPFHHRDPFDRMLVAQAQVEGLTLVSQDRRLAAYDVPVMWG